MDPDRRHQVIPECKRVSRRLSEGGLKENQSTASDRNKRGKKSVAKHFLFFHRLNIRKHRKHVGAAQIICNLNLGCVGLLDHYRILSSSSLVTESSPSPLPSIIHKVLAANCLVVCGTTPSPR